MKTYDIIKLHCGIVGDCDPGLCVCFNWLFRKSEGAREFKKINDEITEPSTFVCLPAYAVSQESASKILKLFNEKLISNHIDTELHRMYVRREISIAQLNKAPVEAIFTSSDNGSISPVFDRIFSVCNGKGSLSYFITIANYEVFGIKLHILNYFLFFLFLLGLKMVFF